MMHETKTTQRVDMLSLLIVSNNPKAKLIQNFIQPLVKSKITLVADFEHGLNEVFDNRPATIIIQDLIAGVASGPATRHIRQMLGNDAPAVIMIQEGSTGISPVEGIFDYIVNLDQSDETLIAEISSNVKNIISGKPGLPPSPRIPVESAAVPVEADIAAVTPDGKPLSDPDVPGIRKSRILLVEDNLIVQRVALTMLSNLGCVVDIVPDGQQAVTALELINYDMVLMDWMMPRMDGLEATARIRGDESNVLNHAVPIIALTSNTKPGDREKCLDAGMNDYLAKPVNKAYLAEVIKKWLNDPDTSCAAAVESDQEVVDVTEPDATTPPVPDVGIPTKNVLLVEDNLINQRVALSMLNNLGCNVDIVPNGQKAVAALELKNYDMVLMDWNMPRMDGIEATVIIRDRQSAVLNHAVPIIALTSNSKPGDREKCLEAGMSDYLSKPVKKAKLAKVIEKWLNNPDENEVAVVEGSETLSPEVDASTANVDVPVMAPQNIAELDSANREQLEDCFRKIESLEQTITEKMVELDGLNEQLQIETDGRSKAEEALGQAAIDAEALKEQLQIETDGRSKAEEALGQAAIDAEALKEQLQIETDGRSKAEEALRQAGIDAEALNEQLQVEADGRSKAEEALRQAAIDAEALKEQLQVEADGRSKAEEALRQAAIDAEALNEQLQVEADGRSRAEEALRQAGIDAEALKEQLQIETDGRSKAEEALRQAGIDAEALKEQLQVERDDWEHQESSLEQTIIVRTRELAIANEQVQVERDARKDAEENLGQVTIACEALNKQVEVLNEYLQAERAERSHVESKLKQEQELLAKIIDDLHAMPTGTVNESVATMVDRNTEAMPHPADSPFRTGGKSSDPPSLSRLRLAGFLLTALVMASAVTGGWYLFKMKQKLSLPADQSKKTASSVSTTPAKPRTEKPVAVKPPVAPAPANKKTMTDVPKSDLTVPSFVTVSGRDSRFSVGNAAWERYVDAKYDIRIYREAGRLKAVQVLAAKGHVIVESFMRDALHEVAGSSDYKRTSSETKEGFLIQRYSVGASSRLVVYRELQSNKISAFVVQL